MKLAGKYQVDDLGNMLHEFTSWHFICKNGLSEQRPAPAKVPAKPKPDTIATSARSCLIKVRAADKLSTADRQACAPSPRQLTCCSTQQPTPRPQRGRPHEQEI